MRMNMWWGIKRRVALVLALGLAVGIQGRGGGGGDPGTCLLCDDSTILARPLWRTLGAGNAGLDTLPFPTSIRVNLPASDPNSGESIAKSLVPLGGGQIWYAGGQASGTLGFYVADQSGVLQNAMSAGATIEASSGLIMVKFTSPKGTTS
jgi:hypothetical protein